MKPTGNTDRHIELSSWRRQPQIKNAVLNRICAITSELKGLQAQMHSELIGESGREHRFAQMLEDANGMQVFNDFKAELDQFRRILWFYVEAVGSSETGMDQEEQANRLQHVNELMRALTPKNSLLADSTVKHPTSFFERLDMVMDTYMQEKKPVVQVKAAKAGH